MLAELEALGDAKVRDMNSRSGAGKNQFGVKLGDLRTVAKKIKSDHALALELWKTKNADAQLLATLLLNPKLLSAKELESLVQSVTWTQVGDWLHSYVTKEHASKEELRIQWMTSNDKMLARAAWRMTAGRVVNRPEGLDLPGLLDRIDAEMARSAPEIQWTMNACLAEIGIHHPGLRKRAIAIGEKLGIYRDYPTSKGCTSPFAPIWIAAMVARQK